MTYIKNRRSTFFFVNKTLYEILYNDISKLVNLYLLKTTIYVVKNKKNQNYFTLNFNKNIVIKYNKNTIYRI